MLQGWIYGLDTKFAGQFWNFQNSIPDIGVIDVDYETYTL